ncbi:MAG: hypothetical protein ABI462_03130 [Ignavibacteria bacterium]
MDPRQGLKEFGKFCPREKVSGTSDKIFLIPVKTNPLILQRV